MKEFRKLSRNHVAATLDMVRKQNRLSYNALCHRMIRRAEAEWFNNPVTQYYVATGGANSIAAAYNNLDKAAIEEADHIWSLK